MDRARLKGYGALLLVFALGILVGGGASRALLERREAHAFRDRSMFEQRRLRALGRRLDLSFAQSEQVRAILAKYGPERRQLTREMLDRCAGPLREQKARMDAEIRAQLNPEQQARYDQLVKDSKELGPVSGFIELSR